MKRFASAHKKPLHENDRNILYTLTFLQIGLAKPPRVLKYSQKFNKCILNSGYSVQNSLKNEIPICRKVRVISDCDEKIGGTKRFDDIPCHESNSELSVLITIFNRKLQISKNVHKISMDSVINDERDCVAIFGFNKALIISKFEMMCCYIQINWNTFTIL
jgi:hypothetical protein